MTRQRENRKVIILENAEKVAEFTAVKLMEIAETALANTGRFTLALSGGKTPVILFQKLAELQKPLSWDRTHIFIVDERLVPFDSEESNFGMIRQILLSRVNIPEENVYPIQTDTGSPQESAEKYEEELRSFFGIHSNEFPKMDLILLGIGEDGHTASLFPGAAALHETGHLAVAVSPIEQIKRQRISLTLPLINNAENIIFMVSGKNKAAVVRDVVEEERETLPASQVRPAKGNLFFFLDEEAGSLLFRTQS
ncbi:6-phosphogluconolactonase [bacterium]|nr:MAG: 6-phosphogluconolactonase [bacterium]